MSHLPSLLQELNAETLLDAACGDFNWIRYTDLGAVQYVGVDVVPDLIQCNRSLYATERLSAAHVWEVLGPESIR